MTLLLLLSPRGLGLEGVCLGPACSVGVLDIVQERSHNASPSGLESTSVKAGDREATGGAEGRSSSRRQPSGVALAL